MSIQWNNKLILKKADIDVVDYVFDWTNTLATGEEITASTFIVETGLIKDSDSNTILTATIWLSGGTLGKTYTVTNTIVTNSSRTISRSIKIKIEEL